MTDVDTAAATRPTTRPRPSLAAALVLILAVGQFVSPVFSGLFGGAFTTADRAGEPPIVPAGYTFSIWGLIEVVSLAYAIWALWWRGTGHTRLVDRLSVPLVVVFAGFSVWIVAAEVEPNWTTLAVFVVMLVGLLKAMTIALQERATIAGWPKLGQALLWVTIGLYLGWSSIAIWLNLATGMAGSGAPIDGTVGTLAQLAILAGATGTAMVILSWTRGLLPYAAAVAWAFVGGVIGAAGAGQPLLAAAAGVGLALTMGTLVVVRRRRSMTAS